MLKHTSAALKAMPTCPCAARGHDEYSAILRAIQTEEHDAKPLHEQYRSVTRNHAKCSHKLSKAVMTHTEAEKAHRDCNRSS